MHPRSLWVVLLAVSAAAQERQLSFAWPSQGEVRVLCEHRRDDRSFTQESVYGIRPGEIEGTSIVGQRSTRVTHRNGVEIPDEQRPRLAALELDLLLVPEIVVRADGSLAGVEPRKAFLARCRTIRDRLVKAEQLEPAVADAALLALAAPEQYELLSVRAQDTWNDWVGRWLDLDFSERADAEFTGEVELPTGDVVEGEFSAAHLGPVEAAPELVALRIEFEAGGPRLDAAALVWRQRLFGGDDQPFEHVALDVRESWETTTDPDTLQPATVAKQRTFAVTVGGETRSFAEGRRWTFRW